MMSKKEFIKLASSYIEKRDVERFARNVFKLFDEDKNGFLDFGEFTLATSAHDYHDRRERLVWMLDRVHDQVLAENKIT